MSSARHNCACILAAVILLLGIPSVASAASAAKGTVRGSTTERARPTEVQASGTHLATVQWEPDDNIGDSTFIDSEMDDGLDTLTGTLTAYSDNDDVYKVYLYAGETISLSMGSDGVNDFGLYLFGPEATDVYADTPVAEAVPYYFGGPDTYPLEITYEVRDSGYYYINPATWVSGVDDGGSGNYTISVSMLREGTGVDISSPTTYGYLSPTYVDGSVWGNRGGVPSGNAVLYYSTNAIDWIPMSEQSISSGSYSFRGWDSFQKTYYMVLFPGDTAFGSSANTTVFSSRAGLTGVSASRLSTRKYRLSGYLGPQHPSGSSPVRIYLWRKVSGSWKAYGYQKAVAGDSDGESRFTKTYTFPYKGSWRLQAHHSDAGHVTTRSGYTYESVY